MVFWVLGALACYLLVWYALQVCLMWVFGFTGGFGGLVRFGCCYGGLMLLSLVSGGASWWCFGRECWFGSSGWVCDLWVVLRCCCGLVWLWGGFAMCLVAWFGLL